MEAEENPNIEAHHERHRKNRKMGGQHAGHDEGNPMGSRGDTERHKGYSDMGGSRTNKKG